jgi:hypothetical protein
MCNAFHIATRAFRFAHVNLSLNIRLSECIGCVRRF